MGANSYGSKVVGRAPSGSGGSGGFGGGPNGGFGQGPSWRDPFNYAARQLSEAQSSSANEFFTKTVKNMKNREFSRPFGTDDVTVRGFSPSDHKNSFGIGKRYEKTINTNGETVGWDKWTVKE